MNTFLDLTPPGHKNSFKRDRRYKTDWFMLFGVALVSYMMTGILMATITDWPTVNEWNYSAHDYREAQLHDLMMCESSGRHNAMGDNGKSSGYYQWQKPSLEDVMSVHDGGRVHLRDDVWIGVTQNYEEAHYWTYYTIYELNQGWRWYNCWIKKQPYES